MDKDLIKKILLPTDGSKHSLKAAGYAIEIAKKCNAKVTLLHILESSLFSNKPIEIGIDARITVDDEQKMKERAKNTMKKTQAFFNNAALPVEMKYYYGHPVKAILEAAKKDNFDLIIMGSRGIGGVTRLMLGSVSDGVSRHAHCPVLIVR